MRRMVSFWIFAFCSLVAGWGQQVSGSGTVNLVPRWTSSNTIGNSALYYNPVGQKFGIGTSRSVAKFHILTNNNFALWVQSDANGAHVIRGEARNAGGGTGVEGFAAGNNGYGVHGVGGLVGVWGEGTGTNSTGVHAIGSGVGIIAETFIGSGTVAGLFHSSSSAADLLLGTSGFEKNRRFRVDGNGNVFANSYNTGGADFAESVGVSGNRDRYEPGDVLAIDPKSNRRLILANEAYSTLVAGIYSTKPGIVASPHEMGAPQPGELPLALVGIVPCKVIAENGPVQAGDLLVTSSTPGYAMKATDRSRMTGAIVGKAMEPLPTETGIIQVLVTLQ